MFDRGGTTKCAVDALLRNLDNAFRAVLLSPITHCGNEVQRRRVAELGSVRGMKNAEGASAICPDQHQGVLSLGHARECLLYIRSALRRLTIHTHDDLTRLQPCIIRRATGLHTLNHRAVKVLGRLSIARAGPGVMSAIPSPQRGLSLVFSALSLVSWSLPVISSSVTGTDMLLPSRTTSSATCVPGVSRRLPSATDRRP